MAKLTANNSSAFQMLQPNTGTFAMTNLFNASAAGNPNSVEICLDIPLSNEGNPCSSTIDGQCSVAYSGQGASTNPGGVLACPALAVLGSVSGRNETWGVQCGLYNNGNNVLPGVRDFGSNVAPVYDLNIPAAAVGYPVIAANTPSTVVCIDSVECGALGNHNHFLDAYLFDTTQNPPTGGNYAGTINGINGRSNKTWNIAFFIRHPNLANIQSFTGGQVIVPNVLIGGNPHTILIKHEQGGGNNFPQVIFVWTTPDPTPRTIRKFDFKDYSDYLLSNAFWNAIQSSPFAQGVIQAMANPTNGAPPVNAIRPNGSMYWDGFKLGNEVWGTVSAGTEAKICYDELSIAVEGKDTVFGKETDCPDCDQSTLTLNAATYGPGDTITATANVVAIDGSVISPNGYTIEIQNSGVTVGTMIQQTNGQWRYSVDATCTNGQWSFVVVKPGCQDCVLRSATVAGCENNSDCTICIDPDAGTPDPDNCTICIDPDSDQAACLLCVDGNCGEAACLKSNGGNHILTNNGTMAGELTDGNGNPILDAAGNPVILQPGDSHTVFVPPGEILNFQLCCSASLTAQP